MDRANFFFKQKVKATELRSAFTNVENALKDFLRGFNYVGIVAGAEVTQSVSPNLTVNVTGPATIYDQEFNHIEWFTTQNVNCAVDETDNPTAVTTPSQSRWLSIFAEFRTELADPRIDGNGNTVYYSETESFQINVVQGAQSLTPSRPALRGDQILIADVLLLFGQTSIVNADIETDRSQIVYDLQDSPASIKARSLQDALSQMLAVINAFSASTISASAAAGSPFSLPGGTIGAQLAQLLANENTLDAAVDGVAANLATTNSNLSALDIEVDGLNTIAAITDSPLSLTGGTIVQAFTQLLAALNDSAALLARANTFSVGPQTMNAGGAVAVGANTNNSYAVDATGGGVNDGSRNTTAVRARGRGTKPGLEVVGGLTGPGILIDHKTAASGLIGLVVKGGANQAAATFEAGDGNANGVQVQATGNGHGIRGDASNDPASCGLAGYANGGRAGVQGNAGGGICGVEGIGVSTNPGVLASTLGTGSTAVAIKGECPNGRGVLGTTTHGDAVRGESSDDGDGVHGVSVNGNGVEGESGLYGVRARGTGTNGAGMHASGVGTGSAVLAQTAGAAPTVEILGTGTGPAIRFSSKTPSSLTSGDFWFDGTNFKCRIGSTVYNVDLTPE